MPTKKKSSSSSSMYKKIAGVRFKQIGCSTSKRNAQGRAKSIRNQGGTARVLKSGTKYCVYAGPKSKVKIKKKK